MLTTLVNSGTSLDISKWKRYRVLLLAIFSYLSVLIVLISDQAFASPQVTSTRLWAGPEYTRLTIESNSPIKYSLSENNSSNKIVMALEGVSLTPALESLKNKVDAKDPFIRSARIERSQSQKLHLVLGLKVDVTPKLFTLEPMEGFGHRLVLDIYPSTQSGSAPKKDDPLMALVSEFESRRAMQHQRKPTPSGTILTNFDRKPSSSRNYIIAIDAGHGGKDPGAIGPKGTREKDVTLAIAKKLKARIDKEPNMRAVLIRDGDYFIPLTNRRTKARQANADLFISVHADAVPRLQAHGSSVYALSENGATSTTASWLAKKENESDLIGGVKLDDKDHYLRKTLIDLSLNATINDSIKLASNVLSSIGNINHLHKRNVEQAGFAVLKSPDIPSILVETAFISNPNEEEKLRSQSYQDKMADAITVGIKRYFANNSIPTRTELAQAE